jgi:fatty acid desaturase
MPASDAPKPFKAQFDPVTNIDRAINKDSPFVAPDSHTKHAVSAYDAMAQRNEYLFRFKFMDCWLLQYINDKRDIVTAWTFINLMTVTIPLIFLNLAFDLPLVCAPLTFLFNVVNFTDRFILGLHYSSHVPIWKGAASFMNYVPTLLIAPFFGLPSGGYWTHHILMHHKKNNEVGGDLSSTEPYQRDNFLHFLHYWIRFLLGIWFELPLFAFMHGPPFRRTLSGLLNCGVFLSIRVLLSSLLHLYLTYLAVKHIPWAGSWLVALPLVLSSFLLMFGNWCQHMFVDPTRPWSNFALSYTCMNSPSQQRSFNDGYHINHHIAPNCHWADLPADFENRAFRFVQEGAFCFSGIDNFGIGLRVHPPGATVVLYTLTLTPSLQVFTGNLNSLADYMVNPVSGGPWKADAQGNIDKAACIAELKRRLQPVPVGLKRPSPNDRGLKAIDRCAAVADDE